MITAAELLDELQTLGSAQYRKTYARHGIGEPMYGVSYAHLEALRKRIKIDQALAEQLWASGNHDARVLATMIADPRSIARATLQLWAAQLGNHVLADAFAKFVAQTAEARTLMADWLQSDDEWRGRAGWHLLAEFATRDPALPDSFFEPYLQRIEREIHTQKNRVREAMNNALIAIGVRGEHLEQLAIAAAGRIGKVHVDHGATNCKTPHAIAYIQKTRARQHKTQLERAR